MNTRGLNKEARRALWGEAEIEIQGGMPASTVEMALRILDSR